MHHVNEHPILDEHVICAAPEVQAVDTDAPAAGRDAQVLAGMVGQHAVPAGSRQFQPFNLNGG